MRTSSRRPTTVPASSTTISATLSGSTGGSRPPSRTLYGFWRDDVGTKKQAGAEKRAGAVHGIVQGWRISSGIRADANEEGSAGLAHILIFKSLRIIIIRARAGALAALGGRVS